MNKFGKVFAAGVVAAVAFGGQAFAEQFQEGLTQNPASVARSGDYGYVYNHGFLTSAVHGDGVNVRFLADLPRAEKAAVVDRAAAAPARVSDLQAAIRKDATVVKGLRARNINVGNVIATEAAVDGSTTYIVK